MKRRILSFFLSFTLMIGVLLQSAYAMQSESDVYNNSPFTQVADLAEQIIRAANNAASADITLKTILGEYRLTIGETQQPDRDGMLYNHQVKAAWAGGSVTVESDGSNGFYVAVRNQVYYVSYEELVRALFGDDPFTAISELTGGLLDDLIFSVLIYGLPVQYLPYSLFSESRTGLQFTPTSDGGLLAVDFKKISGSLQQKAEELLNASHSVTAGRQPETVAELLLSKPYVRQAISSGLSSIRYLVRSLTEYEPLTIQFSIDESDGSCYLTAKGFSCLLSLKIENSRISGSLAPFGERAEEFSEMLIEGRISDNLFVLEVTPSEPEYDFKKLLINANWDDDGQFAVSAVSDEFQITAGFSQEMYMPSFKLSASADGLGQVSAVYNNSGLHIDAGESEYSTGEWLKRKGAFLDLNRQMFSAGYRGNIVEVTSTPFPFGADNRIDIRWYETGGEYSDSIQINSTVEKTEGTETSGGQTFFRHKVTVSGFGMRDAGFELSERFRSGSDAYLQPIDKLGTHNLTAAELVQLADEALTLLFGSSESTSAEETTTAEYGTNEY